MEDLAEMPFGVAEAHKTTLRQLIDSGDRIETVGGRGPSSEILGYRTGMQQPRYRLAAVDGTTQRVVGSVARFVWLLAGSDRLEDIAYYESRVREYSDDGVSVPGSSYGRRIFNSTPGLNQIAGVVDNLETDPDSRRAAAVVWTPEDAVRVSHDIPCTFGMFFHIRHGELTMTTVMRSNNAFTLLPYNFFEFSMIGEMVAASRSVPFGGYVHWAASMHTFDEHRGAVDKFLAADSTNSLEMLPMPSEPAPLEQAARLARAEAELRNAATEHAIEMATESAKADLNQYWFDLYNVLLSWGYAKRELQAKALEVVGQLPDYFRSGVQTDINKLFGILPAAADDGLFPEGLLELEVNAISALKVAEATRGGDDNLLAVAEMLREFATVEEPVTVEELLEIIKVLGLKRDSVGLAARSSGGQKVEKFAIGRGDVQRALLDIRK